MNGKSVIDINKLSVASSQELVWMKRAIWSFFLLLIFENALRKWFLPSMSTPLLLIRDPIAVWLVFKGIGRNFLKNNTAVTLLFIVTLLSIVATMIFGHGNLFVALYGARIFIIYFPLSFVIAKTLNLEDIEKIGVALLYISILMTAIIVIQYRSLPSAWINIGVGGSGTSTFAASGAGEDVFRPSGTFSFTNGVSDFYALVAPFVLYFWLKKGAVNKYILYTATFCLLISIPVSVSRTLLASVLLSVAFSIVPAVTFNRGLVPRFILIGIVLLVLFWLLSKSSFFNNSIEAFQGRIEASNTEGSSGNFLITIYDRLYDNAIRPLLDALSKPIFGLGLGLGTNVGAAIFAGSVGFLVAEMEIPRLLGEMGLLLGLAVIFIRFDMSKNILVNSFKNIRMGNYLPWLLSSSCIQLLAIGQLGNTTNLGFMSLEFGLILGGLIPVEKRKRG